jgi:hypothetical protein
VAASFMPTGLERRSMLSNSPAKMGHFGQSHQSACPKRLHRRFRAPVAAYLMFQKTRNGVWAELGYLLSNVFCTNSHYD